MDVPVALFLYKRPETLRRVFDAIRAARPRRLLLVADAPRSAGGAEEADAVRAARAIVEQVDWSCEVSKDYAAEHLGCGERLATGLDWVFRSVKAAIILEDDCLPHPDFFPFCAERLAQYGSERRVLSICGTNPLPFNDTRRSHFFSNYTRPTGWATWRSAWRKHFDLRMRGWKAYRDAGRLAEVCATVGAQAFWRATLDSTALGLNNSWGWAWQFAHWKAGSLTVRPPVNLVQHLGYGAGAVHHGEHEPPDPWRDVVASALSAGGARADSPALRADAAVDDRILKFTLGMVSRAELADLDQREEGSAGAERVRLHERMFHLEAELRMKEDVIQQLLASAAASRTDS